MNTYTMCMNIVEQVPIICYAPIWRDGVSCLFFRLHFNRFIITDVMNHTSSVKASATSCDLDLNSVPMKSKLSFCHSLLEQLNSMITFAFVAWQEGNFVRNKVFFFFFFLNIFQRKLFFAFMYRFSAFFISVWKFIRWVLYTNLQIEIDMVIVLLNVLQIS